MLLTNQSLIETHCNAYLATLLTMLAPLQHDVMLDRVPSGQSYFGHTSSMTKMGVREEDQKVDFYNRFFFESEAY